MSAMRIKHEFELGGLPNLFASWYVKQISRLSAAVWSSGVRAMRGVVQSMVLGVSTVALLACQGCQAGQASAYGVNAQQYNAGREVVMTPAASARPLPDSSMGAAPQHSIVSSEQGVVLQADPSFSLTQGQTTTSP